MLLVCHRRFVKTNYRIMSNLIWLNTKVKILINRINVLAEVHSLLNSNIVYKI